MTFNLHACVLLATLLILVPTSNATEASCAGTTCASGNGTALLQITNRGTKKVNAARGSDNDNDNETVARSHCGQIAANVPLTSAEYENVKEQCCLYGMAEFVRLVAETHRADPPHMGYTICNPGFAPGVAVWHGCEGDGEDQTFQSLLEQIERHAGAVCTSLAKPGEACPVARPQECIDYPGEQPQDCGCSQSKSVALDFKNSNVILKNLGGQGPTTTDPPKLRFERVGKHGDPLEDFDLEVEVVGSTAYETVAPERNDVSGEFGQISLGKGSEATFKFTFKKTGTEDETELSEFLFTVFDIDGVWGGHQSVAASDMSGYVVEDTTRLKISKEANGQIKFLGEPGPTDEVTNPTTTMSLTQQQRDVAVMLSFKKVSTFELTFSIVPLQTGTPTDVRNFLFGGQSALSDHCGP